MDDKRIEELLRESWKPHAPAGMRGRVLRRGREELPKRKHGVLAFGVGQWKVALASLALLLILLSGISDHARQCRLSALINIGTSSGKIKPIDLRERQLLIGELTAKSLSDNPFPDDSQTN